LNIVETALGISWGSFFCYNRLMPTKIYDVNYVKTIYGEEIEISPLKIKYMRQFMEHFSLVKNAKTEEDIQDRLIECATIAMKQFYPNIKNTEDFEDVFDLKAMYKILEYAGGINMDSDKEQDKDEVKSNMSQEDIEKSSWENLDLNKLESEAFLLGIWKSYDELESSICLSELMAILEQKREMDYQDKKFTASLKGINLDEAIGKTEEDPWEAMKARVAAKTSGVGTGNPNDITSFQGIKAQQAGFGIGHGLDYEVINDTK
jgi:hypothetical protein